MEKENRPWWKQDSPELQKMKHWLGVLYALVVVCIVAAVLLWPLFFGVIAAVLLILCHTYKLVVEYIDERIENKS